MATDCHETNPPMSILLYMPLALLERLSDMPEHILFPLYTLFFVLLACLGVYTISRHLPELRNQGAIILTALFLLAATALSGRFFGERDHFVFMGVMVFLLAQHAISLRLNVPKPALYNALILGGIGFLIKPHYVLVAIMMSLIRAWEWKSIRAVLRADFFILGALGALYLGAVLAFFPDYLHTILPGAASLYAQEGFHENYTTPFFNGLLITTLSWFAITSNTAPASRPLLNRLFALAALSLLIFLIQKKGWGYHLVPFHGALYCALFIGIYCFIRQSPLLEGAAQRFALTGCALFALAAAFLISPIPPEAPDHRSFHNNALAQKIRASGEENGSAQSCRFMMFSGMREVQSLAYYNHCMLASRFAVAWFFEPANAYFTALEDGNEAQQTQALARLKPYADMLGEDLARYRPPIIFGQQAEAQFFTALQQASPLFEKEWAHYTLEKSLPADVPDYFAGTRYANQAPQTTYDLYRRKGK